MLKSIKGPLIYTLINVGGSFLPLFAAVLYAGIIDGKTTSFSDVTGKGEITIICIPLCITILFTLYHYKKEIGISKIADFIYGITFFWLALAVGLYAYGMKGLTQPKPGLITFSTYFLIWTIISMIFSKYIEDDNILSLKKSRSKDQNNLEEKFNQSRN